ncbi:MAG: glycosyltransferase family 1 protein, partial [Duncaniella sp.]|nr:glycosyltransferase family 1 protein [Duncaniella sp.]
DRLLAAARRVAERYPDKCTLEIVENIPYAQYIERMRGSHVVLDQLYSYTPATNALLAMAMGLNTVSGGEEDYYHFIGEERLRPIINAEPDDEALYRVIEETVLHPEEIKQRGLEGREFVVKHNDIGVVARRFVDFWTRRLEGIENPAQNEK